MARMTRSQAAVQTIKQEEPTQQLPSPSATPRASKRKDAQPEADSTRKRRRAGAKDSPQGDVKIEEQDVKDETMHGIKVEEHDDVKPPTKKSTPKKATPKKSKAKKLSDKDLQAGADMAAGFVKNRDAQREELSPVKSTRAKNNPYGLSPGESPYPWYEHPTPEECHEVNKILSKVHGKVSKPKTIPAPSLNSSGCGEVPAVLDALIRTRLSAATNNNNSSRAFRGLVDKFGIIKTGIGKGSVDWDKVRRADQKDVFEAIKTGGLADVKSRDIKSILQMVYEENQERREHLEQGQRASKDEKTEEDEEERSAEVGKAKAEVLSLDHLHLLDNDTAFNKLLGYPGIGPKTASCVLLFCMQRPSFAVDTHVFRLTTWLGWVPTNDKAKAMAKARAKEEGAKRISGAQVTRNSTYAHLDVRIPDDLKYPLHYLLIKHGKNCGWCSAKAGKDAKVGVCPLAHLMKGKGRSKGLAKKGQAAGDADSVSGGGEETDVDKDDDDDEDEDMSDELDD